MIDRVRVQPEMRGLIIQAVVYVGVLSCIINVLLLISPLYMMQVYNRVLPSANLDTLIYISIVAVGGMMMMGVIDFLRTLYCQRLSLRLVSQFASLTFLASVRGHKASQGDIGYLRDLSTTKNFIASKAFGNIFDLPFMPLFLGLLYLIHPVLFWVTMAGVSVLLLLLFMSRRIGRLASSQSSEALTQSNLLAQAFVRNSDTVRSMGMATNVLENWGNRYVEAINRSNSASTTAAAFSGISRITRMLLQLAILGTGAILVLTQEMTAGLIFASSIISGRALQPLDQIIGSWSPLMEALESAGRLRNIVADPSTMNISKVRMPAPRGAISLRDLQFSSSAVSGSKPILSNINLEIQAGSSLAIVGPSRSGKSTLARLLVGVLNPSGGTVSVDGAKLENWDQQQLGMLVGYLSQDVQLLPGTIAENICRFSPQATSEEIVAAAICAGAHELITGQPQSYQTVIGSGSVGLSGGERQRVALARAFYGNPKIVVLDEPNASLDSQGDAALAAALHDAKARGVTIVIITHRLPIASTCDNVLVLRDGQMDIFGPARQVLELLKKRNGNPQQNNEISSSQMRGNLTSFRPHDSAVVAK